MTMIKTDSEWEAAPRCGELRLGLGNTQGVGWGQRRREGSCVPLWLTHGDVRQKPTQYRKAIILQIKMNRWLKNKDKIRDLNMEAKSIKPQAQGPLLNVELSGSALVTCPGSDPKTLASVKTKWSLLWLLTQQGSF